MDDPRIARVGIGVFIFKDGKFLMGQRHGSHGEGTWSVPGGHMEFGESFEETATREVAEETGLSIKKVCFGAITNDFFTRENKHYVTIWMASEYAGGTVTITELDKFTEMRWFDFERLPAPLFLPWTQLLTSEFLPRLKGAAELSRHA